MQLLWLATVKTLAAVAVQASVARYAELEEALAQAEQSMDHIMDDETVCSPFFSWLELPLCG
jgi:hypothetical protein